MGLVELQLRRAGEVVIVGDGDGEEVRGLVCYLLVGGWCGGVGSVWCDFLLLFFLFLRSSKDDGLGRGDCLLLVSER